MMADAKIEAGEAKAKRPQRQLLEEALLRRWTGTGYLRFSFNEGGVTNVKPCFDEPLPKED